MIITRKWLWVILLRLWELFYFTAPGRLLVAEDEFAKGIINKMELNRVARQELMNTYN